NRADKRFPLNSPEVNRDLGTFVKDLTGAQVKLKDPEISIYLDIQPKGFLVYFDEVKAHGGLPVGVSGKVAVMLSGGIDSPVAAWQMMKRGCQAMFVHFHSYPLVDRTSMEKAADLVEHLTKHQYESNLFMAPLGEIQKQIILSCPPSYRVVLYRRFMVRITEALARKNRAKAIITGESCGQVASQTLENIAVVDQVAGMPILRPLIGHNKEEIIDMAQDVGTFTTSILPDQDCCTLFVPKHPETKAVLDTVLRLEELLSVDEMVREAVQNTERRHFASPEAHATAR
ncbi:MAG: tRNA uracil 4-sulfurtransferase ThiI, partial [Chloroflexota bacterium]|nr:tRNA uracil 4-sulfurtransferase ThiI [Chloroflexota bacterium]